ncbi:hypothetical protein PT974_07258 [Cladobotryum mycophilum]|uniref:Rhodopsin domain-containing protein n=1 Tax=Cladobotryum mycophilum TaxID=491253 RepID=A0ABR0SNQ9_9HYPO
MLERPSECPRDVKLAALPANRISKTTFMAVAWAVTGISFLFLLFRLTVRIRSFKKLYSDDYLVIAAWLMLLATSVIWQIKVPILYQLFEINRGGAPLTTKFTDSYATFMPHIVTWSVLFYSCLWSVKFSFLLFFRRLGSKITHQYNIWWWIICVLTFAGWVACIADIDYKCKQCAKPARVQYQNRTFYGNMAADIFTDFLVLSIPLSILWNVQIPRTKKLILAGIFSVTIFIMVVAIIRVVLVRGTENQHQNARIDWLYMWTNVEMGPS